MWHVRSNDDGSETFMVSDVGTNDYEPFSLVTFRDGQKTWTKGIRRDRSAMFHDWRGPVDAAIAIAKHDHDISAAACCGACAGPDVCDCRWVYPTDDCADDRCITHNN